MLSLLMDMIKDSQSTQSNACSIFTIYLKKDARDRVHVLAHKHQSFYEFSLSFLVEV